MGDSGNIFHIQGGYTLNGSVEIGGSKNATTPILAATLLTDEPCRLKNVPRIGDVHEMLEILQRMGASVRWEEPHALVIETSGVRPLEDIDEETRVRMRRMRSSVLFLGPLLARFGKVRLPYPGGCEIGARPIDAHLSAFRDLGCAISEEEKWIEVSWDKSNIPQHIILPQFSVTATENVLLALAGIPKDVAVHIAAAEPHVQDLARFLTAMGAIIETDGWHGVRIRGAEKLHGASHGITPDYIESGTFLSVALATGGDVYIHRAMPGHLRLPLKILRAAGARIDEGEDFLHVHPSRLGRLGRIQTMPYPGIPTDLQPFFAILATQAEGPTLIHDPLYEDRMQALREFEKFGARVKIIDEHRAIIEGHTYLRGARVRGIDLRGSAALVVAGLAAEGETTVDGVGHVARGYEEFEEKLRGLGAKITTTSI